MKHFFRSLLLSLLLTGVIGAAFWLFQQGTFFDPAVNGITTACLVLLLAIVWYLFLSNLWFHHRQRKQRVLDAAAQPAVPQEQSEPEPAAPAVPEVPSAEPDTAPEPTPEPEPANGPEATVFIPPQPGAQQPAAPAEGWTTAPESAQRPAAKPARSASSRSKTAEEKAAEKARKLQQAAQEKQARRARKLEEDAARQQQKLEELKAKAAQKKAAAPKKRVDWKNVEQETDK